MAQNDDLLHAVGGGHPDAAVLADLVGDVLDEHIRRLGLFGVDDVDVVVLLDAAGAAGHAVGVEDENDHAFFEALIVAQDVRQLFAGGVQTLFGKGVELVPRKDDVVAVHQQVLGGNGPLLGGKIGAFPLLHRAESRQRVPLDGAIGPLKNFQQLLVLFQRSTVGCGPALRSSGGSGLGRLCSAPAAVHVHIIAHLVPRDDEARAVGAEDGVRRVLHIVLGFVARSLHHLLGVMAGAVAVQRQAQPPPAPGVADHLHGVAAHGGGGGFAREGGRLAVRRSLGRVEAALHPLDIVQRPAQILGGQLQPEGVPRLQQLRFADAAGHHQPLPHGAVGGLPEIAALGVLEVGAARDEGDFHIRQRGPDEDAQMLLFFQMGQHQPLPVFIQHLFPAVGGKLQPAAGGQRLQLEVDFRIVAEGLVVAHALHGLGDRFLI